MAQGLDSLPPDERAAWNAAIAGAEIMPPFQAPDSVYAESHPVDRVIYTDGTGNLFRAWTTANGFWGLEIAYMLLFGVPTLGILLFIAIKVFLNGGNWP